MDPDSAGLAELARQLRALATSTDVRCLPVLLCSPSGEPPELLHASALSVAPSSVSRAIICCMSLFFHDTLLLFQAAVPARLLAQVQAEFRDFYVHAPHTERPGKKAGVVL